MKTIIAAWCIILAVTASLGCRKKDPIVSLRQGYLKGAVKALLDGTSYYSFKGIPYAQPPVGKLRFAAPLPPKPWQGTYEAINHRPVCPQYDVTTQKFVEGSEDCLFLNIYTRSIDPNSKTPVMFFIHGGAYISGSGNTDGYGPEFLLQHDVIVITINYRLEVLGFLCLDTPEGPGNAAMKDQVLALRWIKNNIAQFGGDPDNVTIFGQSAGATSVVYHMHSPMSKGLFNKVIAESGVTLHDYALGDNGKQRAFSLAKFLGKETDDTTELLEFLQSVPAIKLANVTYETMTDDEKNRGPPVQFLPVIEKDFGNLEPFLTEAPIESLLSKKMNNVPVMLGYNSAEGVFMLNDQLKKLNYTNANTQYMVPKEIAQRLSTDTAKEFGDKIRRYYVGNREFTSNDTEVISEFLSDTTFVYNIHRFTHFYSSIQRCYLYRFSFETDLNVVKNFSGFSAIKGATHSDELFYLFYNVLNKGPYEEQEKLREIVFKVTKLWTDFAKTGNPTPNTMQVQWTPYTAATRNYLDINERLTAGQHADRDRMEFWDQLYCEADLPCIAKGLARNN